MRFYAKSALRTPRAAPRPFQEVNVRTRKDKHLLSMLALLAFLTMPAVAAAEEAVVPPSNSAATQYTEAFPTTGGGKKTDEAAHHRSPVKVLGGKNAHKLQRQGAEGRAAAKTAAATAPEAVTPTATTSVEGQSGGSRGNAKEQTAHGGRGSATQLEPAHAAGGSEAVPPSTDLPAGSSGIGSALETATGLSGSDGSGPLLPLVILATIAWSLAYLWRQRRRVD